LLGLQFRYVETFVLNEQTTQVIEKRMKKPRPASIQISRVFNSPLDPLSYTSRRIVQPPKWLGWVMLSVGGVLTLHSFAMRRPE
jgi:hypothetical protein